MAEPYNLVANIIFQADNSRLSSAYTALQNQFSRGVNLPFNVDPRTTGSIAKITNAFGSTQVAAAKAEAAMRGVANVSINTGNAIDAVSGALGRATRNIVAYGVVANSIGRLAGAFRESVSEAVQLEATLARVGRSSGEVRAITDEVSRLSASLGVPATRLGNMAESLRRSGLSAGEATQALEALGRASLLPGFERLEKNAATITTGLRAFGLTARDTEQYLGTLNAVASEFGSNADELAGGVARLGSSFSAAGGNVNELVGLLGAARSTTRESVDAISASFRTLFGRIQRPEAVEQLRLMGVELRDLNGQFVGPTAALERLSGLLGSLRSTDPRYAQITGLLGGNRELPRLLPLLQNYDVAQRAATVALTGSVNVSAEAQKVQGTLANQIDRTAAAWQGLIRSFVGSSTFQTLARDALSLASGLAEVATYVRPLLPLLTTLAAVRIGQSLGGIFGRAAAGFAGPIGRAGGGWVPGQGDGDSVPAMLTPGEFVINKRAAQRIGYARLHQMNAQRFAEGGDVRRRFLRKTAGLPSADPSQFSVDPFAQNAVNELGLQRLINLSGALPGASGEVAYAGLGDVRVNARGQGYSLSHQIGRSSKGLRLYSHSIDVQRGQQGQGTGGNIFLRQIAAAAREKVADWRLQAAGNPGSSVVGYHVWPKFGVDGPLFNFGDNYARLLAQVPAEHQEQYRQYLGSERPTVQGILQLPLGEQVWRQGGHAFGGSLDLKNPRTFALALGRARFAEGGEVKLPPDVIRSLIERNYANLSNTQYARHKKTGERYDISDHITDAVYQTGDYINPEKTKFSVDDFRSGAADQYFRKAAIRRAVDLAAAQAQRERRERANLVDLVRPSQYYNGEILADGEFSLPSPLYSEVEETTSGDILELNRYQTKGKNKGKRRANRETLNAALTMIKQGNVPPELMAQLVAPLQPRGPRLLTGPGLSRSGPRLLTDETAIRNPYYHVYPIAGRAGNIQDAEFTSFDNAVHVPRVPPGIGDLRDESQRYRRLGWERLPVPPLEGGYGGPRLLTYQKESAYGPGFDSDRYASGFNTFYGPRHNGNFPGYQTVKLDRLTAAQAGLAGRSEIAARGGPTILSEQTKGSIASEQLLNQEAANRREFLSAQRRLIQATLKGVEGKEAERIAEEDYARAVRGEVRVLRERNTGRILGTVDRLPDNAAAPGAGGFRYTLGRFGTHLADEYNKGFGSGSFLNRRLGAIGERLGGRATLNSLLFAAPLTAGLVDHIAGTSDQAVSGGSVGESRYSNLRGVSGLLQGGIVGATIGSAVSGPIGITVGAVVGGLGGLVSSLREAEKEIRDVKIGNSLNELSDSLAALANYVPDIGSRNTADPAYLSRTASSLATLQTQSSQRNEAEATALFGGFNFSTYQRLQQQSARRDFGPLLPNITRLLSNQAQDIGRRGGSLEELRTGNGGLNASLISAVAAARGTSTPDVLRELRIELQRAERGTRSERRGLAARTGEEQNINAFGRLVSSLEAATDSLRTLQTRAQLLGDAFGEGLQAVHVSVGAEALGRGGPGALQAFSLLRDVGGEQGRNIFASGQALDRVREILPSILGEVGRQRPSDGEDAVTQVRSRLVTGLGYGASDVLPSALSQIVQSVTSSVDQAVQGEHGPRNFYEGIGIDATRVSDELLSRISGPLITAAERSARALEQESNRFAEGLVSYRRQQNIIGEGRDRLESISAAGYRQRGLFSAQSLGRFGQAGDLLDIASLERPFQARQERLTGLAGGLANDPAQIAARLAATEASISTVNERRNAAAGRGGEYDALTRELETLRGRASDYRRALENLTNASERNVIVQERLASIQRERETRQGIGEQFFGSDAEGRLRTNRGILLANQAQRAGGLDNFAIPDQQLIVQTLRSLGGASLTGFNGSPRADDLLGALIRNSGGGAFNLNADQRGEEAGLQRVVVERLDVATTAMGELLRSQEAASTRFFEELSHSHEAFFTRLTELFNRDRAIDISNRLATTNIERGRLNEQRGQADLLASVGVTSDAQVASLRNNRGALEGLGVAVAQRNRLGESFNTITAGIGGIGLEDDRNALSAANRVRIGGLLDRAGIGGELNTRILERVRLGVGEATNIFNGGDENVSAGRLGQIVREAAQAELISGRAGTAGGNAIADVNRFRAPLSGIQGLDFGALTNVIGGDRRQSFLNALDAFQGTDRNLQGLNDRITTTDQRFRELSETLAALRGPAPGPVPGHATGGSIFSPRGSDTVPAMLTPGEFVVNAASSRANQGLLQRINSAHGPAYLAEGGVGELIINRPAARPRPPQRPQFTPVANPLFGIPGLFNTIDQPQADVDRRRQFGFQLPNQREANQWQARANQTAVGAYYGLQQRNLGQFQATANARDPFAAFGAGRADFTSQNNIAARVNLSEAQLNASDYGYRSFRSLPALQPFFDATQVAPQIVGFATGGIVGGAGGTDSQLAALTPGEGVLTRGAVASLGGSAGVAHLNSGGPVYLAGGGVTPGAGGSSDMAQALASFAGSANALADSISRMPRTLTMTGTHTVQVIHNGAEVLAAMNPAIQQMITSKVNETMQKVFDNHMPQAGVQL